MIIVHLSGGLGNQLFQYAFGASLAARAGCIMYVDPSHYDQDDRRRYRLDKLSLTPIIAPQRLRNLHNRPNTPKVWWRDIFKKNPSVRIVREAHCGYDFLMSQLGRNCFLVGYWQSPKYFRNCEEDLKRQFYPRQLSDRANTVLAKILAAKDSVAVHVRRGDYVSNEAASRILGPLAPEYYTSAIHHITRTIKEPQYYVFSDEPDWCMKNVGLPPSTSFVEACEDYEDLFLMSQCKHNIIANSSFSWWAAWLNQNPAKIVIAPKLWYRDPLYQNNDLLPTTWYQL
jgi:hypothetical protein